MSVPNKFYRYESVQYATLNRDGDFVAPKFPDPHIELREFNLHKETPKGYWIGYGSVLPNTLSSFSRWISKTSLRRYAYPTKKEALINFIKRNEKRIRILEYQAASCKMGVSIAKNLLENEEKVLSSMP